MLKKFEMEDCKPVSTPMITRHKLSKDDEYKEVDQKIYASMIDRLLYVIGSRPDVMQAVGQVDRFQETPNESHVLAIKMIFRYLKGTIEFGIWHPKGNEMNLVSYIDVD